MGSHIGHVLVFPFPAQGHVNSLMSLSMKLNESGFKITFVNTDFNHKRVVKSVINIDQEKASSSSVRLVSIPDGLEPEDDRNDLAKLCLGISSTMTNELEKLIEKINNDGSDEYGRITGLVCDMSMAWALEIAHEFEIKGALYLPTSAAVLAVNLHMPKLIDDGIMDSDGLPIVKGEFEISPDMPKMNTSQIAWCCIGDKASQKTIYKYITRYVEEPLVLTDWWLCNTASELEPGALSLHTLQPKILPIGPLIVDNHTNNKSTRSLGQFWEEDLSCLSWLDQQPPCSVIYIAFGSFTIFDQTQFTELALGLELTGRPFLWVVREDHHDSTDDDTNIMVYPDEFEGKKGKIVKWAPQQKVLSHPAVACFISHCGWNSTMEGVYNGTPFLCWPYFADQLYDKTYICDTWKVGLGFEYDENGRIVREEIKKKVEMLLGDEDIRARSVKLKEIVRNNVAKGGRSLENFMKFVEWLKE